MKTLYFDCKNGISGDMLLSALCDLGDCGAAVRAAMEREQFAGHGHQGHHSHETHEAHSGHVHEGDEEHGGSHSHGRSYEAVKRLIGGADFTERAKAYALHIYDHIARAEAKVHGVTLETVHFHEVGRDEAVKNALGIGMALEAIAPDRILASPIYDGKGTILCSHGEIPVPVPAVMALREKSSFLFRQVDVETEMVTPSGLAGLMGIGAEPADEPERPEGEILKETEAFGKRSTGRGGLKAYLIRQSEQTSQDRRQDGQK